MCDRSSRSVFHRVGHQRLTKDQEITLTTSTDSFYSSNAFATFGDLGQTLKQYVESYQSRSQSIALAGAGGNSLASISDMKRFIEEYPEFRKLGGNVSKHVALVGELSRLVAKNKLLETGEVEQGLATGIGADVKVGSSAIEHCNAALTTSDRTSKLSWPTQLLRHRISCGWFYSMRSGISDPPPISMPSSALCLHKASRQTTHECVLIPDMHILL